VAFENFPVSLRSLRRWLQVHVVSVRTIVETNQIITQMNSIRPLPKAVVSSASLQFDMFLESWKLTSPRCRASRRYVGIVSVAAWQAEWNELFGPWNFSSVNSLLQSLRPCYSLSLFLSLVDSSSNCSWGCWRSINQSLRVRVIRQDIICQDELYRQFYASAISFVIVCLLLKRTLMVSKALGTVGENEIK
jgi:hypothetical protein